MLTNEDRSDGEKNAHYIDNGTSLKHYPHQVSALPETRKTINP